MSMSHRNSLHHLYYSSQADPTEALLRTNNLKSKSSYQLNQLNSQNAQKFGSRWTLAQYQAEKRQEKVHNTYYNNMVCYINNKQSDTDSHQSKVKAGRLTAKSVQSLQSALAEEQRGGDGRLLLSKMESKELGVDDCAACSQCDNCCCSCWTAVMMLLCLILGLVGGGVCGVVLERSGYLTHVPGLRLPPGYYPYLGQMPGNREPNRGPEQGYGQGGYNSLNRGNQIIRVGGQDLGPGLRAQYPPQPGDGGCVVRMTNLTTSNCSVCSNSRVLNVTGAGYADCNGLYTLSNNTSIWDSKRVVYERIAGGWGREKRYIYWNAHFYGENFYGWSIGDSKSLVESGPFHSQGRGGVSNQPWQGSWRSNVTVQLTSCMSALQPWGGYGAGGRGGNWGMARPPIQGDTRLRWNGREEERRRYEEERRREREREINLYGNIERNNPYREGG